jgi:hypothetical protein
MSDYSEKWDGFDYLTVAGVALFLGGLGLVLFRTTRRGALLLPAGLACMATAAYGARRNGVASTRSDNRGEDRLNLTMLQGSLPELDIRIDSGGDLRRGRTAAGETRTGSTRDLRRQESNASGVNA